jgi:hypothetical protein
MCELLFLLTSLLVAGQEKEFWDKKDYTQWSERECKRLLTDSPWAKSYTLARAVIEPLSSPGSDLAREAAPRIQYVAQFRSALPIRQALVRISQIKQKYDRMGLEQKREFDRSAEQFLAKSFADAVVLYVSFSSNVQIYERDLIRHWQFQTQDMVKNYIHLIGYGGERVAPLGYTFIEASRAFQLIFPRQHNGRPLIGPADKSLRLEFQHPRIGDFGEARILIEFKTEKMLFEGSLVY